MGKRLDYSTMTPPALFALAHRRLGKRGFCDVISEMQRRGGREFFDHAAACCKSSDPRERMMGANILGQLGLKNDSFRRPAIKCLLALLHDGDPRVICAAASAIGHRRASEAVPRLIELSGHKKWRVRLAVVFGLLCQDSEPAVATMIRLSQDTDPGIRNWATFGLAQQVRTDTEAVRTALIDRAGEADIDIRCEALIGLARRCHPDALRLITEALAEVEANTGYLEAAAALKHPALLPALYTIREKSPTRDTSNIYFYTLLDDAIKECSEAQNPGEPMKSPN